LTLTTLLGIACGDEKDYADALDAFQHALKLAPNSTITHNNLGNLYVVQQKARPRRKGIHQGLGVELLQIAMPITTWVCFSSPRGSQPAAIRTSSKFSLRPSKPNSTWCAHIFRRARPTEALKTARQISAENKQDVQLHFTLGVLLATQKQYKAAQIELEQANALQPETFEILHNLGLAYLRGGEYTKAALALDRALKLKPDSPETLWLAGGGLFCPIKTCGRSRSAGARPQACARRIPTLSF
jgi:tetratricopeptide (TPR) repeat protein